MVLAGDPLQLPPIHEAEPPLHLEALVGSVYTFCRSVHGVPDQMLKIWDVLIATGDPVGDVIAICTLSGCDPVMVPERGNVKVLIAFAGIALPVPTTVRTPSVAAPLLTVSVSTPVLVVALPA